MSNKTIIFLLVSFVIVSSCTDSDDAKFIDGDSLATLVAANEIRKDNVIACASGSDNDNEIIAYLYPRSGATEIRYYETETAQADKNDYANYVRVDLQLENLLNGYLQKFKRSNISEEKWVIITFMEDGVLHLSNPIRLKHRTQNTLFKNNVHIGNAGSGMPLFSWGNIATPHDVIYFQIVSNEQNQLLSGTYTLDTFFQYYKTENVVLNITQDTPPTLIKNAAYNFLLMGVSEDNWVNLLAEKPFTIE